MFKRLYNISMETCKTRIKERHLKRKANKEKDVLTLDSELRYFKLLILSLYQLKFLPA